MDWAVIAGDALQLLKEVPDNSVDSLVSDPPAGIEFGLAEWDSFKQGKRSKAWACCNKTGGDGFGGFGKSLRPAFHTQKAVPGDWDCFRRRRNPADTGREGVFGRTSACAPHSYGESDRGSFIAFLTEIMVEVYRVLKPGAYGVVWSIPRTSHWTAIALEDGGFHLHDKIIHVFGQGMPKSKNMGDGFGTALKPSHEDWLLVRKPVKGSITANYRQIGTGAMNIDGCRVPRGVEDVPGWHKTGAKGSKGYLGQDTFRIRDMPAEEIQERCGEKDRWPPNMLVSDEAIEDLGDHARFFPCFGYFPKPGRAEKEAGLAAFADATLNRVNPGGLEREERFAPVQVKNNHPTVKSVALMSWLCRLVTPPNGIVLDPFCGSGSTGVACIYEGFRFLGLEQDVHFAEISEARIRHAEAEVARGGGKGSRRHQP
jgi:DNA modification methylase